MPKRNKRPQYTKQKRRSRGRTIHAYARTTPGGRGRIKKRRAYKKYMGKKKKKKR